MCPLVDNIGAVWFATDHHMAIVSLDFHDFDPCIHSGCCDSCMLVERVHCTVSQM